MCLLLEVLEPLRLLVTEALALQRSQRSRSAEEMLWSHSASDDERAREAFGSLWSREQNRETTAARRERRDGSPHVSQATNGGGLEAKAARG